MKHQEVKLFKFNQLPNDALFYLALNIVGKNALESTAYEYMVGFFTHENYKYGADGIEGTDDYNKFLEINNFFINNGCGVNDVIYVKW